MRDSKRLAGFAGQLMPRFAGRPVARLLVAAVVAGCGAGSGEGLDLAGRPLEEGGNVPLAATLESIQVNLFDAACVVCHAGAAAPLGLRLDAANSFTNLVGVPSRQDGAVLRVVPGDPDNSYLVQKLEGTATEGERMPLGGPPVPDGTIDFVRQWIADGAAPGGSATAGEAPVVVSMDPAPGSTLAVLPAAIVIGFSAEIDASTVNAMTIILERSADGNFGNGNDVALAPAAVSVSGSNPRLAVVELAGIDPVEDRYRLTVHGSGPSLVLSVDASVLDGEFDGNLPSGDGNEGGDFVAVFEVGGTQPNLESIQADVFTPSCAIAGCHTGPIGSSLPSGMDLGSADGSFASLVGIPSLQSPGDVRVVPGDADASYLVMKIEGTAPVGGRMPLGSSALDIETIDLIRAWIDAGAAR